MINNDQNDVVLGKHPNNCQPTSFLAKVHGLQTAISPFDSAHYAHTDKVRLVRPNALSAGGG